MSFDPWWDKGCVVCILEVGWLRFVLLKSANYQAVWMFKFSVSYLVSQVSVHLSHKSEEEWEP